ncbi:TetR/AcrR family transcriptional regulator [Ilumatobacter coccineus]|uniref:Putative TetR family transcriptional regulator n=1 Tax=Ilumatobacter coccineus (strain NBRC 103263 / KCTC 29153 / YM16-304) TaxID=1313172 RepID=A0A6C7EF71_ILUCY|nr:TetR/AcrR family transcriptional regulator [Ilumatobacter coccineus]BAN04562.1 putative TetR family transcriptional regulator [Ilumatobacter coccineus YM16-304]
MARPVATAAQRAAQRQRIRDAARHVYDEGGIDAVTVRRVAEQAGLAQGTIYKYFRNHIDLVRSLWLGPIQVAGDVIEKIAASVDDPAQRLRAILTFYRDFVIENPDVHRGVLLHVRRPGDLEPDPQPLDELPLYRTLRTTLVDLHDAGRLVSGEPDRVAELLWAAMHGSLGLAVNADIYEVTPSAQLSGQMLDFLLDAVVTTGGSTPLSE